MGALKSPTSLGSGRWMLETRLAARGELRRVGPSAALQLDDFFEDLDDRPDALAVLEGVQRGHIRCDDPAGGEGPDDLGSQINVGEDERRRTRPFTIRA